MRPLLNTLYVTTEGAWLRKDGENLVVEVEGQPRARLPVHMLQGLVCIGHVLVSPALMGHCAQRGICISHLSPNGRFLARVEGPVSGNVLLRRAQYRCSDQDQGAAIARHIVAGKVFNQRAVLARATSKHWTTAPCSSKTTRAKPCSPPGRSASATRCNTASPAKTPPLACSPSCRPSCWHATCAAIWTPIRPSSGNKPPAKHPPC